MDRVVKMCELCCLDDVERLSRVEWILRTHGIRSAIWPLSSSRTRLGLVGMRLVVACPDLLRARWVASAAGLDTWPQEAAEGAGNVGAA